MRWRARHLPHLFREDDNAPRSKRVRDLQDLRAGGERERRRGPDPRRHGRATAATQTFLSTPIRTSWPIFSTAEICS
jgi:hypothetical protein